MSSPTVNEARTLAKRHGLEQCVVLYTTPDGAIGYVSYGTTRALCEDARRMADRLYDEAYRYLSAEG